MNLQLKPQKTAKNTYLEAKKKTNIVLPNMFIGFKETKKRHSMFWRQKDSMKGKCHNFSCHKQKNKVCLVYFECKLQEVGYGWSIFKL